MRFVHAMNLAKGLAKRHHQPRVVVQVMRDWDGYSIARPCYLTLNEAKAGVFCFGVNPLGVVNPDTGSLAPVYRPVATVYPDGSQTMHTHLGETFDNCAQP